MWVTLISTFLQTAFQWFVRYKTATTARQLKVEGVKAYIEGVRAVRILAICIFCLMILFSINTISLLMLFHAIYLAWFSDVLAGQGGWMVLEFSIFGIVLLINVGIFSILVSHQTWMTLFRVPELLEKVRSSSSAEGSDR